MSFLTYTVVLLGLIVCIAFINERTVRLTYEIALMLFASVIGVILTLVIAAVNDQAVAELLGSVQIFDLEEYLMKGVLCLMLFAGSCHMRLTDFKRMARQVSLLAVLCTLLGAVFYGLLFYGVSRILSLPLTLPMCLMFGSVVAPTDPIAATSILSKFGLPKDLSFLIEGESLLNDGVGVALFVCFSGMVTAQEGEGFLQVLFRELFGAVGIGVAVTAVCLLLFRWTADGKHRIYISILAVSLSYLLCEHFECSGAIASVVCGVLFSYFRDRMRLGDKGFDDFWEISDNLLNSILYVILGLTFVRILQMPGVIVLSLFAIVCNLLGRSGSLFVTTFFMGTLPDGYDRKSFVKLLTWGGLRGGLSIALALSTSSMLPGDVYHIVLGCTYAIVFFTTIIQGSTVRKVYEGRIM
ncbi:MAG: cation:proton antiporter [Lachnospiraceae bacterium]|nr:cation:proton antiporter [Lachnospiraceae bacterium]